MPVPKQNRKCRRATLRIRGSAATLMLLSWGLAPLWAQDFPLLRGSYLSATPAQAVGLALATEGEVVIGLNLGIEDANPANDQGRIEWRRPDSAAVITALTLPTALRSLRQGGAGEPAWVAASTTEVLMGTASGAALAARFPLSGLAAAPALAVPCGTEVAVLAGSQLSVFSATGTLQAQFPVSATALADLACLSDGSRLFVTGYRQASAVLQVAFVEAYDRLGARQWRSWGWSNAEVQAQAPSLGSDTRGQVLRRIGNALYFAGSSAGGVPVFMRNPQNLALNAGNTSFDLYNQTSNLGGASIGYFAELDPGTGEFRRGQFLLTRLSSGAGNSVSLLSLALDSSGRLQLGGRAFAAMANRSTLQVAGQAVGPYSGGDPHLLVVPGALTSRTHWTTFVDSNGRGSVVALASRDGREALLIESNQGSLLTPAGELTAANLSFTPSSNAPASWLGLWGNTAYASDRVFANGFE